jgi:GNAT superfamily N-acetyltransferase
VTDSTDLPLHALDARHIAGCERLVAQAGWNQVADDWRIFLELGHGFGVSGEDGQLVATAATLPFDGFAWISMVLVDAGARRRGLATRLLARCVESIRAGGRVPFLDATPAGREVYRRIGFRDLVALRRWQRDERVVTAAPRADLRAPRDDDWPALLALDRRAFGADRAPLVRRLAARSGAFASVAEGPRGITGFVLGRDGRVATQVGPLVAADEATALCLLDAALAKIDGPVFLDALDRHAGLTAGLQARGFVAQRPFTRMAHESDAVPGDPARYFLVAGPELG